MKIETKTIINRYFAEISKCEVFQIPDQPGLWFKALTLKYVDPDTEEVNSLNAVNLETGEFACIPDDTKVFLIDHTLVLKD